LTSKEGAKKTAVLESGGTVKLCLAVAVTLCYRVPAHPAVHPHEYTLLFADIA
jgi:hypothetical protein